MEWDNGATIGFNAAGEMFANNDPSTSDVACSNSPFTIWSNVIFRLSANSSEPPPPCMSTLMQNYCDQIVHLVKDIV